jgi:hypothetical protein
MNEASKEIAREREKKDDSYSQNLRSIWFLVNHGEISRYPTQNNFYVPIECLKNYTFPLDPKDFEIKTIQFERKGLYTTRSINQKTKNFAGIFITNFIAKILPSHPEILTKGISIPEFQRISNIPEVQEAYKQMLSPKGYSYLRNERFGKLVNVLEVLGYIEVITREQNKALNMITIKNIDNIPDNVMTAVVAGII